MADALATLNAPRPAEFLGDFINGIFPTPKPAVTGIPADADAQERAKLTTGQLPANGDQVLAPNDSPLNVKNGDAGKPATAVIFGQPWKTWGMLAAGFAVIYFLTKGR